jgi:hypothetical protein
VRKEPWFQTRMLITHEGFESRAVLEERVNLLCRSQAYLLFLDVLVQEVPRLEGCLEALDLLLRHDRFDQAYRDEQVYLLRVHFFLQERGLPSKPS